MEDSGFFEFSPTMINRNKNYTIFNDATHSYLEIHDLCRSIVDTPEFQRLRFLKQCGVCNFIYPSANHSRFEHCLGVSFKAKELLDNLETQNEEISEEHRLCIQIAGLCHDLGHGPFSHLWETFIKKCGKDWEHEDSSITIFKKMIDNNNLMPKFLEYNLTEEHVELICDMITGKPSNKNEENMYLYEIIANKGTQIDVDKMEYLKRDSFQFGLECSDSVRIIHNISLITKDGKKHIGFRDKVGLAILEMFLSRAKMHRICYQHQGCKVVETMLLDALIEADRNGFAVKTTENKRYKLSDCHKDIKAFLKLDDSLLSIIHHSIDPEFEKARQIINRMFIRDLYMIVLNKVLTKEVCPDKDTKMKIECELLHKLEKRFENEMKEHKFEFRTAFVSYNMGGNEEDPLENVIFYDKEHKIVHPSISSLFPHFYTRDTIFCYNEIVLMCTLGKKSCNKKSFDKLKEEAKTVLDQVLQELPC